MASRSNTGILIACSIILIWTISIVLLMQWHFPFSNPLVYFLVLVQMHWYTGLFITAHDAMHGTVASNSLINRAIGQVCTFLYALFPFNTLNEKHHRHHRHVHTADDPDHHDGHFLAWYWKFIRQYLSIWQVIAMALIFNILQIWIPQRNLLLFWVLPSLLSTLQLFYFGTWLPHHGDHDNQHHSRTLSKNHVLAFFSCYFFGYHYEHHDSPGTPWWRLWQKKADKQILR